MYTRAAALFLAGTLLLPSVVAAKQPAGTALLLPTASYLSANIPLDSYIYDYLDKLDGLGYLTAMRPSAKPYTRMQAAQWVQQIEQELKKNIDVPQYAAAMLRELERELATELAILNGETTDDGLKLREWQVSFVQYDGDTIVTERPKVTMQPLNYNNDGFKYDDGFNATLKFRIEGKVDEDLLLSLTPRVTSATDYQNDFSLAAGYLKTRINNVEIQVGKDSLWWGTGKNGTLIMSNNAEPQVGIVMRNLKPLRFNGLLGHLGDITNTFIYSELDDDRTDVESPSFVGWRSDFVPGSNFTFGLARTSIVGGKGHALHRSDYWDFIIGKNAYEGDKWNSIAGIDFRWRLPQLNGLQLYGEIFGEDQADGVVIPTPSKTAYLAGAYLPRLIHDGEWDLTVEWARTNDVWYVHGTYHDGYTHKGDIIGDPLGRDATRYYVKLTNYRSNNSQLSLHYQYTEQNSGQDPQSIDSAWLSWHRILPDNYSVKVSIGKAKIENFYNHAGRNQDDYFTGITLTKRF